MIDAGAIVVTIRAAIEAIEPEDHEDARRAARRAVWSGIESEAVRSRAADLRHRAVQLQVAGRHVRARSVANRASHLTRQATRHHAACVGALAELAMLGLDAETLHLVRRAAGIGGTR